jgi:hypothetical protein
MKNKPLPDDWDEDEDESKPGPQPERLNVEDDFEQAARRVLDAGTPDAWDEDDEDEEE